MTTCLSVIRPPLKPFSKPMRKGEYYSHDLLEMAAYGILGLQRTKENETPEAILRAGTTFGKSGKIKRKNQSK